ncbi:MAG: GGDEF domain-containing protein, partial [Ghiorsea sp.]|nr:GGDEF domain-containing protein [Ghiorsea sp.]
DAGDLVLKKLSHLLKIAARSTDMVARLGGEEFCIVLPETNLAHASNLAEKIRHDIENETFQAQQGNIEVKVSIGVAERHEEETIAKWLKRADTVLYQAKRSGRNQVFCAK